MTTTTRSQPAVLVFPGQGSQWVGMAADLLDTSPVFAARLRECARAVQEYVDWSVEDVLRQRPGAPSLDRVEVVQPVLFSVHVALAELWFASGLVVGAVVGQSQGEIAAAYVAGALSLDDAARIIVMRSQLFAEELVGHGGIASIALSANEINDLLATYQGRLEVAGVMGPHACNVAGEFDALEDVVTRLTTCGIRAKVIPASIPSHCAFIEPLRQRLTEVLACVRPQPSRIPLYSTVTGNAADGRELTADYWYANARQPVLFDTVIRRLLANGYRTFVECSAHPTLTASIASIASIADAQGSPAATTGTLRRGRGGLDQFHASLAAVQMAARGEHLAAAQAA